MRCLTILYSLFTCILHIFTYVKTEISHGDHLLSPRYGFFQRMITEHNSALLMGGRSWSNSGEEITLQVPSLDPPFANFIKLCFRDFQAVESFAALVNQLIIDA